VETYVYTAKVTRTPFTGEVGGDSKQAVVAELRRKGLPSSSSSRSAVCPNQLLLESSQRIKHATRPFFARQFATMINSGLAVLRACTSLKSRPRTRGSRRSSRPCAKMSKRDALSDAMADILSHSTLYGMVRAGEAGGALERL